MKKERSLSEGVYAFPPFPVVMVTVKDNIITVGAVHIFSFDPPLYGIGIVPKRYSHGLIEEANEFIINFPTREQIEALEFCGTKSGRDVNKFKRLGLTPQRGKTVETMLIKECPANIECKVIKKIDLGGSHTWFIGEIQAVHIDEEYDTSNTLAYDLQRKYRTVGEVVFTRPKAKK